MSDETTDFKVKQTETYDATAIQITLLQQILKELKTLNGK